MILDLNISEVEKAIKEKIEKVLFVVANQLATNVQQQIRDNKSIVSGNLLNSINVKPGDEDLTAKVYTNVFKYAPRVEFGFVGKDSLGRYYNQPPKSFMRLSLEKNKDSLIKLSALLMERL